MATNPPGKSPIVEKCNGCDNIEGEFCRIWAVPAAKWRMGVCPSASHTKIEAKEREEKVRVGQQKQRKK